MAPVTYFDVMNQCSIWKGVTPVPAKSGDDPTRFLRFFRILNDSFNLGWCINNFK